MSEPVRPVALEAPQQGQKWVNPDGTATHYGQRWKHGVYMRLGAYNDDVWTSLGIGFTAISQQGRTDQQIAALEGGQLALQGQIGGLRGDPRLATADVAKGTADDALSIALSRAPADVVRRVEELEHGLAQATAAVNELRAALQQQAVSMAASLEDISIRSTFDQQTSAAVVKQVNDDLEDFDATFQGRVRNSLSGTSPVVYTEATGDFALNANLTSLGGLTTAADKGYYTTALNTWASADLTAFGRSVWALADAAAGRTLFGLGSLATLSSINNANWSGTALSVANGGTGSTTASAARTALGLDTMATQAASAVAITGGSALGMGGVQITGATAPTSGSGLEIQGGAAAVMAAYNRTGGAYISLNVDASVMNFRPSGSTRLSVSSSGIDVPTGTISVAGTQAITTRRTGWAAATGTATRTTFDTATVTLPQLAERVKALTDDLTTHGLIGA